MSTAAAGAVVILPRVGAVSSARTKLLVASGAIALSRCDDCVELHVTKLIALGATKADVMETAAP